MRAWPVSAAVFSSPVVLLACGCAGGDGAGHVTTTVVDTVAGVERITSSGEAPRWTVTPTLELGSAGGDAEPSDDEFAWVSAVSIGPDGLVYVADLRNHRIAVFDTLGNPRKVIGREGSGPGEFRSLYSIAFIGTSLATLDLKSEDPVAPFPDKVVCTRGRGFSWFDHPFVPRSLAHPARDNRSIVAITSRYEIGIMDTAYDTLRIIRRDVEPPRLGDEEWGDITERFDEWLADKDVSACRPRSLERPGTKPFIESLMVGVDGRIWVERNLETGTVWEVFDPDGRLVGSVDGFDHDRQRTIPWFGEDRIAWVSRGPDDMPRVHVARIRR